MIKDLLILELVLPILVGSSHFINRKNTLVYVLTSLTTVIIFCFSLFIALHVFAVGDIYYYFGGWIPPVGIEFKITKIKAVFAILISAVSMVTFLHGKRILFDEVDEKKIASFCGVFLLCNAGFLGIISTNDFFNLYVFIEVASLTSYALVAISNNKASFKAAFNYLIIGTIAATFILIGIGYIYAASGTLNIDDFISKFPGLLNSKSTKIGYHLILVGLLVKSGLFPLHTWFVDSYKTTNSFILPFLSGVSSKTYIFLVILFSYFIFGESYITEHTNSNLVLIIMGAVAAIFGSLASLYQRNLRYMLIFSSIAQIGYLFIAIGLGTKLGLVSSLMFLASNIFAKTALFMLAGHIFLYSRSCDIEKLHNLKSRMPIVVALFVINGASIIGIPGTIGFVAKIALIVGMIQSHMWFILCIVLISSLISLLYIWKFIECFLYQKAGGIDRKHTKLSATSIPENRSYFSISVISIVTLVNLLCGIFYQEFFTFIITLVR